MSFRELAAFVFFLAILAAAAAVARRATRRPLALMGPFAFALLIAYETLLLNLLSLFHAVTPLAVFLGHALPLISAIGLAALARPKRVLAAVSDFSAGLKPRRELLPAFILLSPLAVILFVLAVAYPPTNWDSMIYHMARVAHWIQNQSIGYYPTSIDRQNWTGPGAEYLLLVLQVLAGSDRWANSVQFLAWLTCVATVPALCRVAGLRQELRPWAAVFVATIPTALLQASSTQNDLIASVLTLGLVIACIPFLHAVPRWKKSDLVFLTITLCGAFLVKVTSLILVLPLLAYTGVVVIVAEMRRTRGIQWNLRAIVASAALAAALLGPDVARKVGSPKPDWIAINFFPPLHQYRLRFLNVFTATAHHSLFPKTELAAVKALGRLLGLPPVELTTDRWSTMPPSPQTFIPFYGHYVFRVHEDVVGSPFHLVVALVSLLLLAATRGLPRRQRVFVALPVASWLVFHVTFRDNPWITRLELPLFVLMPLLWVGFADRGRLIGRLALTLTIAGTAICAVYGYICATNTEKKEVTLNALLNIDRNAAYYSYDSAAKPGHEATLETLRQTGCKRLAVYLHGDRFDYALTWRAMHLGVEVRHYVNPSDWPCLIFSDLGAPPPTASGRSWVNTGQPGVYRIQ
jgi:hypothetical protein